MSLMIPWQSSPALRHNAPRIVWALQAPTLVNRLAQSTRWRCEVADFGDAGKLAEAALNNVSKWRGTQRLVTHVAVCTAAQWRRARHALSKPRLVWVLHSGKEELLPPPEVLAREPTEPLYLAFSHRVAAMQEAHLGWDTERRVHVIVPPYDPDPIWQHTHGRAWAMVNRPETRPKNRFSRVQAVCARAKTELFLFGQNTERGFLTPDERLAWLKRCTAYISVLRRHAGFGLSEHECMAAGVPVIGSLWGDMALEMPAEYGLSDDLDRLGDWLRQLDDDAHTAAEVSEIGLQFIEDKRSIARTDTEVERLLDAQR